jgi:hypothetical protein
MQSGTSQTGDDLVFAFGDIWVLVQRALHAHIGEGTDEKGEKSSFIIGGPDVKTLT